MRVPPAHVSSAQSISSDHAVTARASACPGVHERPVPGSPVRCERSSHVTIMRAGTARSKMYESSGTSTNTRPVEQIGRVAMRVSSSTSEVSSAVMSCCTRA